MVSVVELFFLVPQKLKPFTIGFRNTSNVFNSFHDTLGNGVLVAFVLAPGIGTGSSSIDLKDQQEKN